MAALIRERARRPPTEGADGPTGATTHTGGSVPTTHTGGSAPTTDTDGSAVSATDTVVPVRPDASALEAVVRALALPGVGRARMTRVIRGGAGLGTLHRQVRSSLTAAEREKADGWARTALATIERRGLHVLTPDMAAYPESLHHLVAPPFALFAAGRLELLRTPLVAIVGTRSCTAEGRAAAGRIAGGLAAAGVTVVSGLALGIDGAAHRAAGAARTIGVLGCGVDVPYPLQHRSLQRDIGRHGLLLSEQLPGAPAAGFHFPLRNRIIAALAGAVVVVEAPEKSGALSTARNALELGRPVFAVPGPLGARVTAGSNALIRDGGILVTGALEVLEALRIPVPAADPDRKVPGQAAEEQEPPGHLRGLGLALWRSLGYAPRHIDDLAADLGLDPQQTLPSLLSLEVQGHARQLAGLRFVRT